MLDNSHYFATGPVRKRSDWSISNKYTHLLGRSHRSKEVVKFFQDFVFKLKALLNVPDNFKIILTPASDTGAFEAAMWNMIGERVVDCISWEVFGNLWYKDLKEELQIENLNLFSADYGSYPDTSKVDYKNNDVVLTHSGSTTGVIFSDDDKIPENRNGLVFADSTSYAFFYDIDWKKVDVLTFSWQKVMAGEAQHGVLIVNDRAIERLNNFGIKRAIPKVLSLKVNGKVDALLDTGYFTNTPSILCFIDAMENLEWIIEKGGLPFIKNKVKENYDVLDNWVNKTPWIEYLVKEQKNRSNVISCLKICDKMFTGMSNEKQKEAVSFMLNALEENKAALDIAIHHAIDNVKGFRIWLGYTINKEDVENLTKWLDLVFINMQKKFMI